MYSYFFQVFLLTPYIPTSSRYFCSLHVFLLLPGISAYSLYSYFFTVFLLPPCIPTSSGYYWLLHIFLLLPDISALREEVEMHEGSINIGKK
jgi:hypothetical protein